MGMLDELLGGLMSGQGGMPGNMPGQAPQRSGGIPGMGGAGAAGGGALLAVILQLLQQSGGLSGMLGKMQQSGYGDAAQSWVGHGQNQAIPSDALSQIFGSGALQQVAQQLGMSHDEVASTVSQHLPEVVNRMTPSGSVSPDADDLVGRTLQELMQGRR